MVSAWESSVFHKPGPRDGRQRDVFPLPTIKVLDLVRGDVCRSVQQRVAKRREKTIRVNKAILALNSFFFGGPQRYTACEVEDVSLLPSVQRDAISLIQSRVSDLGAPEPAWRSEALKVLRASAPSAYSEPEVDTGSTVPMKLDALSLPSGTVSGVDLVGSLSGHVKVMVENFEDFLLADASSWNALSDVASSMEPYNDPLLNTRAGYLQFLSRLYDSGVLAFSGACRGRVGVFCVSKKPKVINGETIHRQRLVLDCRQTNLIFKPPPPTRLGSLSSLAEAELPPDKMLYAAGADIKDCFYAVNMEPGLQEFFGLKWDISDSEVRHITKGALSGLGGMNVPVIKVLPMGFSWSFFLVQHLHTQIALGALGKDEKCLFLEGQPPPSFANDDVCIMPYCDNIHSLCTSGDRCQVAKEAMASSLSSIGFQLHEHVEACTVFDTLGGVIDGEKGFVKPTRKRMWHLIFAFECAAWCVVGTKTIQRLLGHSMVVCVLNRSGMAVFRKLYDFVASGCSPRKLHASERDECLTFAGLVPLLLSDIRKEWSNIITCTDASPMGFGVCERHSNIETVRKHGRWIERWRFKRLPASQWKPRERSEGWGVLSDVRTVSGGLVVKDELDEYIADDDFPEIPDSLMEPSEWRTVKMGKWEHTKEHITLKEARALLIAVRRFSRSSSQRNKRHLCLLDNLALCFAVAKGRAHSFDLLRVLQRISAICLACGIVLRPRWVRSDVNVADAPSRGHIQPGSGSTSKSESASQWSVAKENFESSSPQQSVNNKDFEDPFKERSGQEWQQEECSSSDGQFKWQGHVFNKNTSLNPSHKVGGGSWKQGSVREVDGAGVEKCEQRNPESVCGLLSSVRGLLEGERPILASENDKVLADYMDVLFLDKKAPAEGEKTLAALEFFQIELKTCLPRSRRALRGWRKCMPAQSRLPIPKTLMYGMSMLMLHRGKRDMALMVMAAFDLYLRPGEGLSLVARNIVAPIPVAGSQFRVVTVIVRDFDSGVPDKVGVYDTSLRMGNPKTAWVGEFLLKKAKEVNSKDDLIFSFNMEEYRKEFIAVGKLLGVDQLHPYQLRHGGASQDLCSGFRDHQGVKSRGRWVTDQSVRRYAKIGRVQQLLSKLRPNSLNYCTWAETNLEKVFRGVLPSRGL